MLGALPWLVRWTRRAGTIDLCPALTALFSQLQNIIHFTVHFFTLLVPIAQQPGQAGVLGRLSLYLNYSVYSVLPSKVAPRENLTVKEATLLPFQVPVAQQMHYYNKSPSDVANMGKLR